MTAILMVHPRGGAISSHPGAMKGRQFRQRRTGAVPASHCNDARVHELLCRLHGSLRVAGVVLGHQFDLLAEHATRGIDLGGGKLGAVENVRAGIGGTAR